MNPAILVDVDGVLAPYRERRTRNPVGCIKIDGKPFPRRMRWLLTRLAGPDTFYVSTWDERTQLINQAFGLRIPFIRVGAPESMKWKSPQFKVTAVLHEFGDRPLVWFDDSADRISEFLGPRRDVHFVRVPGYGGLTADLVSEGLRWIRKAA